MKNQKEYIFFSMRDFTSEGGGSVRMYGVLNSLADLGANVTFISNAENLSNFHPNIKHEYINLKFSIKDKREFQLIVALYTNIANKKYSDLLNKLKKIFIKYQAFNNIYFFEYLDNSIGYWLHYNKIIQGYSNDIHGIAPLEFEYLMNNAESISSKFINQFKYKVAKKLDQKVLVNANYNLYVSRAMEDYYLKLHPSLMKDQSFILPNLLTNKVCQETNNIDLNLINKIYKDLEISKNNKVILFAGSFKYTAGVLELIKAFQYNLKYHDDLRLIIIGNGPTFNDCKNYLIQNNLDSLVSLIGLIPYELLPLYQSIAHVIVCPDQMNEFSDKIIHFKYLDALLANKVVINGNFKSVLEININEQLSIGFDPTSQYSLNLSLKKVLENYSKYKVKYSNTREYVCENLNYSSHILNLPPSK